MPTINRRNLSKLRRQKEHRRPDRAFVVLDGRKVPCGRWGTEAARQRYDRMISEWLAAGRRLPIAADEQITIAVLTDRYWTHVTGYYVHCDGTPTCEQAGIKQALRVMNQLYADTVAADFGPRQLRAMQERMATFGWARTFINKQISRLKRMFKWSTAHELYPAERLAALQAVPGLKAGRTAAPETQPVRPVADDVIDTTLDHLTPTLQAMVRLHRLTGMRPEDICSMTGGDIDVSGDVWLYKPRHLKNTW